MTTHSCFLDRACELNLCAKLNMRISVSPSLKLCRQFILNEIHCKSQWRNHQIAILLKQERVYLQNNVRKFWTVHAANLKRNFVKSKFKHVRWNVVKVCYSWCELRHALQSAKCCLIFYWWTACVYILSGLYTRLDWMILIVAPQTTSLWHRIILLPRFAVTRRFRCSASACRFQNTCISNRTRIQMKWF